MSSYRKTQNAVIRPHGGGAPWRPILKVTYKNNHELKDQLVKICRTHFPSPMRLEIDVHSRTVSVDGTDAVRYELVDCSTEPARSRR